MVKPLFSVIIPTYNRAEKLSRALLSLITQQYKNFEVHVCDDGSTDNTRDLIELFKHQLAIHYHYEPNWGGPARPRNKGIQHASAEWICFLDSDDTWHPEKLQQMCGYLHQYDVLYHDFDLLDNSGTIKKIKARQLKTPVFHDLMLNGHNGCIINSGVCIRKNILLEAGGITEEKELIGLEDADTWLRVSRITDKFKRVGKVLGSYYLDGGNITQYDQRMIRKLDHLYKLHAPFLLTERLKRLSANTHAYHNGRISSISGNLDQSLFFHRLSVFSPNLKLACRSLYWILLISVKRFLQRQGRYAKKLQKN